MPSSIDFLQRRRLVAGGFGAAALAAALPLRAQDNFPSKPIRIFVGAGAGGTTDITARLVGAQLGKVLGQSVIVENRAGAAGTLSMQQTARAPADGYTLVWVGNSVMAIAPYLYKNPATT
jgi:tripartite-type tricarboxylate transporter receptor subunit TctC